MKNSFRFKYFKGFLFRMTANEDEFDLSNSIFYQHLNYHASQTWNRFRRPGSAC